MDTFFAINDATGFANGDRFTSKKQVLDYFTAENQLVMFGPDAITTDSLLRQWAELVLSNRWHCAF